LGQRCRRRFQRFGQFAQAFTKCKADLLFILRQIRRGSTPDETKTIGFDSRPAPDERIEKSPRDFREMTERIRREAMARLEQPVETSGWSWSQMWRRRAA